MELRLQAERRSGFYTGINNGGGLLNTIKKILAVATIAAEMEGMTIAGFGQVEDSGSEQAPSAGTVEHYEYLFPTAG